MLDWSFLALSCYRKRIWVNQDCLSTPWCVLLVSLSNFWLGFMLGTSWSRFFLLLNLAHPLAPPSRSICTIWSQQHWLPQALPLALTFQSLVFPLTCKTMWASALLLCANKHQRDVAQTDQRENKQANISLFLHFYCDSCCPVMFSPNTSIMGEFRRFFTTNIQSHPPTPTQYLTWEIQEDIASARLWDSKIYIVTVL